MCDYNIEISADDLNGNERLSTAIAFELIVMIANNDKK